MRYQGHQLTPYFQGLHFFVLFHFNLFSFFFFYFLHMAFFNYSVQSVYLVIFLMMQSNPVMQFDVIGWL